VTSPARREIGHRDPLLRLRRHTATGRGVAAAARARPAPAARPAVIVPDLLR